MKRIHVFGAAMALAVLLAASGCTAAKTTGHKATGVWGYVASARDAQLKVTGDASPDAVVVEMVKSPGDAWLVVHNNEGGKPGMRVGLEHITAGESRDVKVALKDVKTDSVIVAVHADKGTPGKFDFKMDSPTKSADRPYFVGGKELAVVVPVR